MYKSVGEIFDSTETPTSPIWETLNSIGLEIVGAFSGTFKLSHFLLCVYDIFAEKSFR